MSWGISDDEMDQALKDLFGEEPSDDGPAAPPASGQSLTPSQLGITAGILSDVPIHQQVAPTDWSGLNLNLSDADLASIVGGAPGQSYLGQARDHLAQPISDVIIGHPGILGGPDIPQIGLSGPLSATQVLSSTQSQPANLLDVPPPDTSRFLVKGARPNYNITLDTALPDGSTIRDRVDALADDINNRPQAIVGTVRGAAAGPPDGPVARTGPRSDPASIITDVYNGTDFKNMFRGSGADPYFLGDTGNFSYGAVTARLGVPLDAAEIPAGLYSLAKHPYSDWGWPYGMDDSARTHLRQGYNAK